MKSAKNSEQLNVLKNGLKNKSITIYDVVEKVLKQQKTLIPILKRDLTTDESAYFRLLAAWCIGKSDCQSCKKLLEKAYTKEPDNNVRANIVWAYFRLKYESAHFLIKLLNDSYFLVRLVAIKNISKMHKFMDAALFGRLTNQSEHEIVRLETIRKAHFFLDEENQLPNILSKSLNNSKAVLEIDALIQAIGLMKSNTTIKVLTEYYKKNKDMFVTHQGLMISLCKAITTNDESSAYDILLDIYQSSKWRMTKYHVMETLSVCGGPYSFSVLSQILKIEQDSDLKIFATKLADSMELTLI